jgi:hypothetical protein
MRKTKCMVEEMLSERQHLECLSYGIKKQGNYNNGRTPIIFIPVKKWKRKEVEKRRKKSGAWYKCLSIKMSVYRVFCKSVLHANYV